MKTLLKLLLVLQLFNSCSTEQCDEKRVNKIGHSLINDEVSENRQNSFPDIVFLGEGIIKQMQILKEDGHPFKYSVENGDLEEPYGDNSSDCILNITSGVNNLRVRLKYNESRDKYDIKGWTSTYPIKIY